MTIFVISSLDDVENLPANIDAANNLMILWDLNYKLCDLPKNIHTLVLGDMFDTKLENIPPNLHTLVLGDMFDKKLENIPPNLHTLILGDMFDKKLENLPPNLHTLQSGRRFNQKLENIPANLHTLVLGDMFDHNFKTLPENLHTLCLVYKSNHKLKNLPETLHTLEIRLLSNRIIICVLSNGTLGEVTPPLKDKFNKELDYIPLGLSVLKIDKYYKNDKNIDFLNEKYLLEITEDDTYQTINIKGRKGMFTKSSNK